MAKWKRGSLQNFYARVQFPLRPQKCIIIQDMAEKQSSFKGMVAAVELDLDFAKASGPKSWSDYKEMKFQRMDGKIPKLGSFLKGELAELPVEEQDRFFEFATIMFEVTQDRIPPWVDRTAAL